MKKLNIVFYLLLTVVFLFLALNPVIYWWENPHLTKMQVYKHEWQSYLLAIPFGIGAAVLRNYR